jgi:hypothetical protein
MSTKQNLKGFFSGFHRGMKDFGSCLSTIINSAMLFIVYLIGVGLTSLVAKLAGKHFLDMNLDRDKKLDTDKKKKTYWSDLKLKKKDAIEYCRQF